MTVLQWLQIPSTLKQSTFFCLPVSGNPGVKVPVVENRVGFQRIFTALSKQHAQFIYKFLAGESEFERTMGGSIFRDFLPINVPKRNRGKVMFYDEKISKKTEAHYLQPGLYSSITDIVEAMNTLIQERNNHRDTCNTIKVSRETRKVKV